MDPRVDRHESNDQPQLPWAQDLPESPTTLVPVEAGATPPPAGSGRPLMLVAVVGILAGMAAVYTFVSASADAPVEARPVVAPASAPSDPVVEAVHPPTWDGPKRATWAHDGSKTITFTLASARDLSVWMNWARPALVVRCQYRNTDAFVALDTSTSFEQDADRRTVRIQWDDEPVSVQQWTISESGRELFAPDGVAFVKRMASARRLRFGFSPFNAEPVTADFAVQGAEQPGGLVAGTCGWRLDGPA